MAEIADTHNQTLHQQPYTITKEIFAAFSPLDQLAAKALVKHGLVQIVDEQELIPAR